MLEEFKKCLNPGQVYRRSDFARRSTAVDRYLKRLVVEGTLQKMARGLYYYSAKASFGLVPPEDEKLVRAFLKSDDFLLTSPNLYNSLGVGTTQLYNKRVVYNHKRHGLFELGGKEFDFRLKQKFPKELSEEFLLVDLFNNLHGLAEDQSAVLQSVKRKILKKSKSKMKRVVDTYAGKRTKILFNQWLSEEALKNITLSK